MFIALTGTPGTGKTSVAEQLQSDGHIVVDIQRLAIDENMTEGKDRERDSFIIDPDRLDELVIKRFDRKENIIFEGHISHLLASMDKVVVLRCKPDVLKERLGTKGWRKKKVLENLEAEIIDVVLCEAVEEHGKDSVFEIDTTMRSVEEVARDITGLLSTDFLGTDRFRVGHIDWSEFALNGFLEEG